MLGPMVNPSFPQKSMVGVFNLELARMYAYLYQDTATFTILHSLDGYDEVSLTCPTKIITRKMEGMLNPENFGVDLLRSEIEGGTTIEESAQLFMNIISGQGTTAQNNNVVCANAGMAIATVNGCSPMEGFDLAKESLLAGKGLKALHYSTKIGK
jgi:anthranilate phosphoribosyltransferase